MLQRLLALFQRLAQQLRREMAEKLRGGQGVDGRALPRKVIPNGRPLGFGRRATGLPGVLTRGAITARQDGFDIRYTDPHLAFFHAGTRRQVARPVVGASGAQTQRAVQAVVDEVEREAIRLGVATPRAGGRR